MTTPTPLEGHRTRIRTRAGRGTPTLRRVAASGARSGQFASDIAEGSDRAVPAGGRSCHPAGSGGSLLMYSAAPPSADPGTEDGFSLSPSSVPTLAPYQPTAIAEVADLRRRPRGAPAA